MISDADLPDARYALPVEPSPGTRARRRSRSRSNWITAAARDLAYLAGVLGMSVIGFVVWVTGVSVTLSVIVLVFGALVWLPAAAGLRMIADLDRRLVGWYRRRPVQASYRRPATNGLTNGLTDRLRTVTTDPRTWSDLGWVTVNSVLGFGAATVALSATVEVIALITSPLWWWALSNPHDQYATANLGIYTVTSTGWALVTTGLGLLLTPVAIALNRGIAVAHANVARRLLEDSPRVL